MTLKEHSLRSQLWDLSRAWLRRCAITHSTSDKYLRVVTLTARSYVHNICLFVLYYFSKGLYFEVTCAPIIQKEVEKGHHDPKETFMNDVMKRKRDSDSHPRNFLLYS